MARNGLVGHTGFVGSHLISFDSNQDLFNSKNSHELNGKEFGHLIFSGARAEKWKAALNPAEDERHIHELKQILSTVSAARATLISTVDVYPDPKNETEKLIAPEDHPHPYGRNRAALEFFFLKHFADSIVVRLPALFGVGLKKNIVFDYIHNNQTQKIDSRGQFQFYNLEWLRDDITNCWKINSSTNTRIFNIVSEPVTAKEVQLSLLGNATDNFTSTTPAQYDLRTDYARFWRGREKYQYSKTEILSALSKFAAGSRI